MAKKKNKCACYVKRTAGVILAVCILAGTCMVPSKVRAEKDLTSDFVDRTYKILLDEEPDPESYGFWYLNLKDRNRRIHAVRKAQGRYPYSAEAEERRYRLGLGENPRIPQRFP